MNKGELCKLLAQHCGFTEEELAVLTMNGIKGIYWMRPVIRHE